MKHNSYYTVFAIASIWLLPLFFMIPSIPLHDYWLHFALPVFNANSFLDKINAFFTKSNEHTIFSAQFVYYINYLLFNGSNKGLFLFNFIFVSVQILIVGKLFKYLEIQKESVIIVFFMILVSPVAVFHWVSSMSGTTWLLADTFFWISIYLFVLFIDNNKKIYLLLVLLSSLIGALSYSTGIPILISIYFIYLLTLKQEIKHNIISIITYGICILIYYLLIYLLFHYGSSQNNNFDFARFVAFYLSLVGSIFSAKPFTVMPSVFMGILALLTLAYTLRKNTSKYHSDKYCLVVAIGCIIYSLTNYALISYGRSTDFPLTVSLTSRYGNISIIFWIGWLLNIYIYLQNNKNILLITLGMIIIVTSYIKGAAEFFVFHYPCLKYEKEIVLMIKERKVREHYSCDFYYNFPQNNKLIDLLKINKHVPFD